VSNEVKVTYFSDILGRFDKEAGKIFGVSVITEGKAKGHELVVDSQTLMEIKNAAESFPDGRLKTKLNHRTGVESVFGYLENFRVDGPKLLADLKMLKNHKDFEQTFEQIEALPNAIGLSVAFVGKEERNPSGQKLARCREILSADLVPEPAANPTGMFEAINDALVDTEKIDNMNTPNEPAGTAAADAQPEISNADILAFLQEQVLPRIEATEQFQAAIQAELEAAEGGEEGEPDPDQPPGDGDPANVSAHRAGAQGDSSEGGTRGGGAEGSSMQRRAWAQGDPAAQPVPAEMSALRDAVINLERKIQGKEDAEREVQLEHALATIKTKTEALTEYAQELEQERTVLLEALRTGAQPVKNHKSEIVLDTGTETDFQSRVKKYVDAGKPKTEAVMLARKDDPHAHTVWLEQQGVVTTL
jgi:hypothetical protein